MGIKNKMQILLFPVTFAAGIVTGIAVMRTKKKAAGRRKKTWKRTQKQSCRRKKTWKKLQEQSYRRKTAQGILPNRQRRRRFRRRFRKNSKN